MKPINTDRVAYIIVVIAMIISGGMFFKSHFEPIDNVEGKIYVVIINIGVITILMERVLEMLLKIWRGSDKVELETDLNNKTDQFSLKKEKFLAGELTEVDFTNCQQEMKNATNNLELYRSETRKIALRVSLFLGVLIALSGFRVLGSIYNTSGIEQFYQQTLFRMADIFLSAGLISGGSDGLHKFTSVLGSFFDQTNQRLKLKNS